MRELIRYPRARSGFTLLELLTVAVIITILSVVLIVGQTNFTRTLLLKNATYDVALSLRNAQVYGIGSRSVGVGGSAQRNVSYGINFSIGTPFTFAFFADTDPGPTLTTCHTVYESTDPRAQPGDCRYCGSVGGSCTGTDTRIQDYTLNNRIKITNFCASVTVSGTAYNYCNTGGTTNNMQNLSVVFARPNTIATFAVTDASGVVYKTNGVAPFTRACITLSDREQSTSRSLFITQVGEISSDPSTTCP